MLALVAEHGGFDGLLNGDDEITAKVIDAALAAPTPLKVIAKYGIGLDSIDVPHATALKIPVLFTPGVNHTTVAEHAFGLMVGLSKHFKMHLREVEAGNWKRQTGSELAGKTLGVIGMGRIGKEVIKRGAAFGMPAMAYDLYWDEDFASQYNVQRADSAEAVLTGADVISLHMNLTDENRGFINTAMIAKMKDTAPAHQHRPRGPGQRGRHRRGLQKRPARRATAPTWSTSSRSNRPTPTWAWTTSC